MPRSNATVFIPKTAHLEIEMDAFTAKNWLIDKAPAQVTLKGDKSICAEPAQHIIEFPGGAIEVSRTTDGNYWAHIIVNKGQIVDDTKGRESAFGVVQRTRLEMEDAPSVQRIQNEEQIRAISVLIKPTLSN